MNLFLLHAKPRRAARYHCDSHVVKMILETTQVLTAVWYLCAGGKEARHYTRPDKTAFCQPVDSDCLDKKNKSARSTISDDAAINININPENETDTMMNQQQQHNKTTNNDFGGDDEDYVIIAMWTEDRWKEEYQKNTKHQPYKLTHTEHPLIKWAASSRARYMFTARLGLEVFSSFVAHKHCFGVYACTFFSCARNTRFATSASTLAKGCSSGFLPTPSAPFAKIC